MKNTINKLMALLAVLVAVAFIGSTVVEAGAATLAGTDITNTATVTYSSVAGGGAPTQTASGSVTFRVDNKVLVTVANTDASNQTVVTPSQTGALLHFTVTNNGNNTQNYVVSYEQVLTDDFDATAVTIYLDADGSGTINVGDIASPTQADIGNIAPGANFKILISATIPASPTALGGYLDRIHLLAKTYDKDGGAETTDLDLANPNTGAALTTMQNVLADTVAGTATGDAARDGDDSAWGEYLVGATITLAKNVVTVWDPVNLGVNPKAIPLAVMQYSIVLTNSGTSSAYLSPTTITDVLSTDVAFDNDLRTGAAGTFESALGSGFKVSCTGGSRACQGAPQYFTSANDGPDDGASHDGALTGGTVTILNKILPLEGAYTIGEIKGGEIVTIYFNVIIQ